jgi:hypothetical protein
MHELGSLSAPDMETALAAKTLERVAPLERKIQAPHFVF